MSNKVNIFNILDLLVEHTSDLLVGVVLQFSLQF
jgi:hypothetical protein